MFRLKNGNNHSFADKFSQTDDISTNISRCENYDTTVTHNGLFVDMCHMVVTDYNFKITLDVIIESEKIRTENLSND